VNKLAPTPLEVKGANGVLPAMAVRQKGSIFQIKTAHSHDKVSDGDTLP
jgi:hypothetical protein